MVEADEESTAGEENQFDTGAFAKAAAGEAAASESEGGEEAAGPPADKGPGLVKRALGVFVRWHPFIFLGAALALAFYAWRVYPEPETRQIPPAELLYYDGADRLYRVINPDLPLLAPTPEDEALAARNAILNLFVFHRSALRDYPQFINPHLLLGEANRLVAEFNPAMAAKYFQDAQSAYTDAEIWESREGDPDKLATYIYYNFLDGLPTGGRSLADIIEENGEEIALRRNRRREYIRFRQAEADISLGHPELARAPLEEIRQQVDGGRREEMRRLVADDQIGGDVRRRVFELGPDEFRRLDLLLARVYDGLDMLDRAKAWYLRFLSSAPDGRSHAFVIGRLAAISMGEGDIYRRVNPETAIAAYEAAVGYYDDLSSSSSATLEQRNAAALGIATANSRLAELVRGGDATGVDELTGLGRTLRGWLEGFSGQALPRRTLSLPLALGEMLSRPEYVIPGSRTLPEVVGGTLAAMAGGLVTTPNERSRAYHTLARENYDRIAELARGTEAGDRATVLAAWESWMLGDRDDAETRFERMLDPLAGPDLILAARMGIATAALDRGDLEKARRTMLGGYAHPTPLWFTQTDADWRKIAAQLGNPGNRASPNAWARVWETLPSEGAEIAAYAASGRRLDDEYVNRFIRALNTMLRRPDFYIPEYFPPRDRNFFLSHVLSLDPELLTAEDVAWRNRLLLEEAWPYDLAQRGAKNNVGFEPFPPAIELTPGGLVEAERVRDLLARLAAGWAAAAAGEGNQAERLRKLVESNYAYREVLDKYQGDPGELHYAIAQNYEALAEIREAQGRHLDALSLTAEAARNYLDVSFKARGAPREMDALLEAGDAFFRAGLLGRTIESLSRFLDRFGYSSTAGTESAMAVVRAENLLGRAHWFLNDVPNALESFRRNISRRTPDRFKSIYYIGRVMLDEGMYKNDPALLGDYSNPLPRLDRNGDPIVENALQAFNWLRQSPGISPAARAWRWSTFDLAKLNYFFAERARREWEAANPDAGNADDGAAAGQWLELYDRARASLAEALDRYQLRRNGGYGLSVRVEPEDYADVMSARFESEYMLAKTLLILAENRHDEPLASLARTHLANLFEPRRYANALFDPSLDRFQLNAAVIREEIEGGNRDRDEPLPRTRMGDDEGPTRSPRRLRDMLRSGMQLLAGEYMRAGDLASRRGEGGAEAAGHYRAAYDVYQGLYDRFGTAYGPLAMVGMGDALARLGRADDAENHYRMARNMAEVLPADTRSDGVLDMGPSFWGDMAENRLADRRGGYGMP